MLRSEDEELYSGSYFVGSDPLDHPSTSSC